MKQKSMNVKVHPSFRYGQNIFNFLEWLNMKKGISTNQSFRMADPFALSDKDFIQFYAEYLKGLGIKNE